MSLIKSVTVGMSALLMTSASALADITVLAWPGGPQEEALRIVVDHYNETSDSQVELLYFSRDNFFDKMLADLAAGSQDFDVMLTATYNVGKYAPFMVPIDDLITEEVLSTFPQGAIDTQSYEGHVYGLPTDLSLNFLYYREDLINELLSNAEWQAKYAEISEEYLGVAMAPKPVDDWNWDDYIAASLFFTRSINSDSPVAYGTVLQLKNLLFNIMIWQATAASYGGDWRDADGNITIDTDAYRRGLEIYKLLVDAEATPADSLSYEYAEANAAFGSGQVAFFTQWSAAYAEFTQPDDYPAIEGLFGITHQPAGDLGPKTHYHSLGLGINANSERQDEARAFLSYLGTNEAMEIYLANGGQPPVVEALMTALAGDRPDMLMMGEHTAQYGFVMNGGASSNALGLYSNMAENFTAYWADELDIDTAINNVTEFMEKEFAN
mgnify:CR=1 FL=1